MTLAGKPEIASANVVYVAVAPDYFEKRSLRRYAGIWSLWPLGVGAVISGHFSGWNLGLAVRGWGSMLIAAAIMALMFLALSLCIAEMTAALPFNAGSYSFARMAMGPFWGFVSRAWITIVICLVALAFQVRDPAFLDGVVWVIVWLSLGIAYFIGTARHRLVLSPEEAAAISLR